MNNHQIHPSRRTKEKQERIENRIKSGEKYRLLVETVPVPWQALPILCGPFLYPGVQWRSRETTRHIKARARGIPNTQAPRCVTGVRPVFKRLRVALIEAAKGMRNVDLEVVNDIVLRLGRRTDTGACVVDLTEPWPTGPFRVGTGYFLNEMRRRLMVRVQALRGVSLANGGWWPAPECMQVLLNSDGSISARMRFANGYQRPGEDWLTFSDQGRASPRQ